MNPKMISDDFDVLKPTIIRINGHVFYASFDGNYTDFSDEDGDVLFSVWGNCASENVATQFCKVWAGAFDAGTQFGRNSKAAEVRRVLGVED